MKVEQAWLGPWPAAGDTGTPVYDRLISEWISAGRAVPRVPVPRPPRGHGPRHTMAQSHPVPPNG